MKLIALIWASLMILTAPSVAEPKDNKRDQEPRNAFRHDLGKRA
jgi:hypothetical protein